MSVAGGALKRREHLPERRILPDQLRRTAADRQLLLHQEVFRHQPALLERAADQQQQMIGVDRLREKVERALFHRGDGVLDAPVRGHDDHRNVGVDLLGRAEHAEAVTLGKAQIREDEGRLRLLEQLDRLGLVPGLEHGMALALERMPQHGSERILVFDQKNLCGRRHARTRAQRTTPADPPGHHCAASSRLS